VAFLQYIIAFLPYCFSASLCDNIITVVCTLSSGDFTTVVYTTRGIFATLKLYIQLELFLISSHM